MTLDNPLALAIAAVLSIMWLYIVARVMSRAVLRTLTEWKREKKQ